MDSPALHNYVMAPAVKGLVAGAFASFYLGNIGKVPLMGMPVSPAILIGSSVAGASLVSALSHDFVLKKIKGNRFYDLEGKALSVALTAGLASQSELPRWERSIPRLCLNWLPSELPLKWLATMPTGCLCQL